MIDYENMSREEVLQKAYETAFKYEKELGNCPQAIMATMDDLFDIGGESAFKSGTGLAGGGALAGTGTCGALTGGYMALGILYGRNKKEYTSGKRAVRAYKATKKLHDKFVEEFDGATCKEVQEQIFGKSFNLWSKEEYQEFEEKGGHEDKCTDVVGKVAQWTADIILDELKK